MMFVLFLSCAAVVVIVAMIFIVAVFTTRPIANPSKEEQGPMPKNHGGFGQRVTGGKS